MSKERETRRHRREVTGGLEKELWQVRRLKVSAKGYRISSRSGENTLVRQAQLNNSARCLKQAYEQYFEASLAPGFN